jgi:hypothetical protein
LFFLNLCLIDESRKGEERRRRKERGRERGRIAVEDEETRI